MPGGPRPDPEQLIVGHIAKPHGTRGEVFVWPLTDRPDDVFVERRTVLVGTTEGEIAPDTASLTIERTRPFKRGLLVAFEGLGDRDAVDSLKGRYLLVERSALAPPEPGEWYYHELLGLEVVTVNGERLGRVSEVYETEPADLLEVEGEDGRQRLIPLAERIVRRIDPAAGEIEVELPAGLMEL